MTTTLTAKRPEDLLAAVPVVLGFEPEDSLVMLTFGGRHQFHARVDLPPTGDDIPEVVAALLRPALVHGVRRTVFVLYTGDAVRARWLVRRLLAEFRGAGIEVLECLRAHQGRWFSGFPSRRGVPAQGVPYDVSSHQFRAQAVVDGRVTLASRAEVAARVAPDPAAVAATEAAVRQAEPLNLAGVAGLVARSLARGRVAETDDLASLLLALRAEGPARQVWSGLRRPEAPAHVELWVDVVRRCPEQLVAQPAAVLGLAAWLAGDGALAWCAVDRCLGQEPEHPLGLLVSAVLTEAVPPSAWDERERRSPA